MPINELIQNMQNNVISTRLMEYWENFHLEMMTKTYEERQLLYLDKYINFTSNFNDIIPEVIDNLELVAREILGCRLVVNNRIFTISMVEIYADGIWDETGDYIKEIFRNNNTRAINKMIMNSPSIYYYGGRIDIKLFSTFLPFSLLIRNLIENNQYINNYRFGSAYPSIDYNQLFEINNISDLNKNNLIINENNIFNLLDRTEEFQNINIETSLRIESGRETGLNGLFKYKKWNFSL